MAAVLLLSLLSLQQGLLVAADAHAPLVTPAPRLLARQAGGEDPAFGFCEETLVIALVPTRIAGFNLFSRRKC